MAAKSIIGQPDASAPRPFFVYVLRSERSGRYYVGCTQDIARRLDEHARGQTASTRCRGPWQLVFKEERATLAGARQREAEIKSWKSRSAIEALFR